MRSFNLTILVNKKSWALGPCDRQPEKIQRGGAPTPPHPKAQDWGVLAGVGILLDFARLSFRYVHQ